MSFQFSMAAGVGVVVGGARGGAEADFGGGGVDWPLVAWTEAHFEAAETGEAAETAGAVCRGWPFSASY